MGRAKELVDSVWHTAESGDFEAFAALFRPDGECRQAGVTYRGPAAIRAMVEGFFRAFPDLRHEIVDWVESGDTIAVELRISGTHTGILPTPSGTVSPTGRRIALESTDYIKVVDGKLASWHVYFDQMTLMAQLGLLPTPAAV